MSGNQNSSLMYLLIKEVDKQTKDYEEYHSQLRQIIWKLYFNLKDEDQKRVVQELEAELLTNT